VKLDREQARIDTCYHEAAHAVFDYHVGLIIRHVYVTEKLNAMCVSAIPVNPYPWQAMDQAVGLFAGEIAVRRRHGRQWPSVPFDEFVFEEDLYEKRFELEGTECDELQALKMLRIAASSELYGDLEASYEMALERATQDVEVWWSEIVAVAERLRETGRLDGEECFRLIEWQITERSKDGR
jgi:hypothetical protein